MHEWIVSWQRFNTTTLNILNHYKKTLKLLDSKVKWSGLVGSALLSLVTLLDLVGLGLIIPIAGFLGGDRSFLERDELIFLVPYTSSLDTLLIAAYMAVFLVLMLLVKGIFSVAVLYWINKTFGLAEARFMGRLYAGYLKAPLSFHFAHNSSEIIRELNTSCVHLFRTTTLNTIKAVSEIALSLGIVTLLVYTQPLAALACVIVLSIGAVIYLGLFTNPTTRWAKKVHKLGMIFTKDMRESLECLIDVRTLDKSQFFIDKFMDARIGHARIVYKQNTVFSLPRYVSEILMAVLMTVIVFIVIATGQSSTEATAVLALYALAAMRLMPIINRLIMTVDQARVSMPAVNKLYDDVMLLDPSIAKDEPWHPSIHINSIPGNFLGPKKTLQVKNVSYHFANGEAVLKNISISIQKGESVGLVGPSGSGKTTLANIILGLLDATNGKILIDDVVVPKNTPSIKRSVGYVPQHISILDDTIRNNISFGVNPEKSNEASVVKSAKQAQLYDFITSLPDGLDTWVGENGSRLSGGQKQRLGIARALYNDPEVLILDEATSSLDVDTEAKFEEVINNLHGIKTLLVIAHRLSTIKNCDSIIYLKEGSVMAIGNFEVLKKTCPEFNTLVTHSNLTILNN